MDASPGQRKLVFGVIALALAGLGAFLLLPGALRASGSPDASGRGAGTRAGAGASAGAGSGGTPALPGAGGTTPGASPAAGPSPALAGGVDIYRLLPFSQAALGQAVEVAQRFAAVYGTYSYHQDAAQYVAGMRGLVTPELAATIERAFAAPGVASARVQQRQVATASAAVTALRAFGPSSMTLVVQVRQATRTAQGASRTAVNYAVTVQRVAGGWQAADIELATAGNS